ncbi:MAG: thiamine pyrophosphate-dependent enzyme [Thermodesulfovibrionales bacterium]|nr:thiamine pyrophosphate-dependent enzyme [Thermodesulfovibrionales bacterium]
MKGYVEKTKALLLGDDAIGRGAIEAGISYASSYPGTPATQILEYIARNFDGKAEWAINEKVALETAIGVSYTGRRALCSMKHVGLNVASDALMTAAYLGVRGGVVIVVADDPGAFSSQNEQDSRYYAQFAKIPCLEPSDGKEAKEMVITAFDLSEEMELPVIVRVVTRICHTSSVVEIGEIRPQNPVSVIKNPARMIAVPSNVIKCHKILNEKQEKLKRWSENSGLNKIFKNNQKKGIVACGLGYAYAKEYGDEFAILKISSYPFNEKIIEDFVKDLEEVWVLEECYPFVEGIVRRYSTNVKGKMTGEISPEGELGPDVLTAYYNGKVSKTDPPSFLSSLPLRPPVMCQGCSHRDFYKSLIAVKPTFTAGDIGCYTLGASPPLFALDTCLCMGAGISQAAGMSQQGVKRVAAVIGDSTFLHAGIPALISAVYNKANILVAILDNSSVAMTGHQPTPLTGITAKGEEGGKVSLEEICKACGAASVTVVDPLDHETTEAVLKEKLDSEGVNVVIARRPCIHVAKKRKK